MKLTNLILANPDLTPEDIVEIQDEWVLIDTGHGYITQIFKHVDWSKGYVKRWWIIKYLIE